MHGQVHAHESEIDTQTITHKCVVESNTINVYRQNIF